MDSQSNALYDNQNFRKYSVSELSFDATTDTGKPKTPKAGKASLVTATSAANSSKRGKFIIVPAGPSGSKTTLETSASPFLSPSPSFSRSKQHHSMKSLRLGRSIDASRSLTHFTSFPPAGDPSLAFSSPNMLMAPQLAHLARSGSYVFSDSGSSRVYSDATSVRSLASIGMGSTDGRRMVIRKVPNSPSELLSYISPPT